MQIQGSGGAGRVPNNNQRTMTTRSMTREMARAREQQRKENAVLSILVQPRHPNPNFDEVRNRVLDAFDETICLNQALPSILRWNFINDVKQEHRQLNISYRQNEHSPVDIFTHDTINRLPDPDLFMNLNLNNMYTEQVAARRTQMNDTPQSFQQTQRVQLNVLNRPEHHPIRDAVIQAGVNVLNNSPHGNAAIEEEIKRTTFNGNFIILRHSPHLINMIHNEQHH